MKTIKKIPITLLKTEFIPEELDFGTLYYSEKFNVGNMLCPCGCNMKTPFPIRDNEWIILKEHPLTVTPSILQRMGCKTHYIIQNGNANIV